MSEKVKLIIEIDKRAYKACQELGTNNDDGIIGLCAVNAIAKGTPLDEVKAKMEERHDIHDLGELKSRSNVGIMMFGVDAYNRGIKHAIEILDRIGKESEDT